MLCIWSVETDSSGTGVAPRAHDVPHALGTRDAKSGKGVEGECAENKHHLETTEIMNNKLPRRQNREPVLGTSVLSS